MKKLETNGRPGGPAGGHGLRRLENDILQGQTGRSAEAISHAECQDLLEWYVQDERAGLDMSGVYPQVQEHLKACASCKRVYDLLQTALTTPTIQSTPPPAPSGLSFLSPAPQSPWFLEKPSQLLGPALHLGLWLNPSYLQSLFGSAPLSPAGGHQARESGATWSIDRPTEEEALLLSQEVSLGERRIHLQAWLARSAPDRWRLLIHAAFPGGVGSIAVNLHWEGQDYVQGLVDGCATFEDIILPDFSRYPEDQPISDFRIELRESAANAR